MPDVVVGGFLGTYVYSTGALPPGSPIFFGTLRPDGYCGSPFLAVNMVGGLPVTGNGTFSIVRSNAPPGVLAVLVVGASTLTSPVAIPLVGCALGTSPDILLPTATTQDPAASMAIPIPANPSLAGTVVYFQWFHSSAIPGSLGRLSPRLQVTLL